MVMQIFTHGRHSDNTTSPKTLRKIKVKIKVTWKDTLHLAQYQRGGSGIPKLKQSPLFAFLIKAELALGLCKHFYEMSAAHQQSAAFLQWSLYLSKETEFLI